MRLSRPRVGLSGKHPPTRPPHAPPPSRPSIFTAHTGPLNARESPPLAERGLPTSPEVTSRLVSSEDIVDVSLDPLTFNTFESICLVLGCPQRTQDGRRKIE